MRKIRNHKVSINNPAFMFAQGLESLISDPLYNPSQHDDQDLRKMQRAARKQDSSGNLFGVLLKQFSRF